MDAQAAIADAQKREDTNKKRRERRSFAVYGVAGKPVIDKDAKRQENNKKKRDNRKIAKEAKEAEEAAKPVDAKDVKRKETNKKHREWCKRKKEEIKEASAFADNILTPVISPRV
jgi:CO/xanthine dehydrogenase FAD-binding subunit